MDVDVRRGRDEQSERCLAYVELCTVSRCRDDVLVSGSGRRVTSFVIWSCDASSVYDPHVTLLLRTLGRRRLSGVKRRRNLE